MFMDVISKLAGKVPESGIAVWYHTRANLPGAP